MMDERRGASDPRHARANVVGSRAPQWRSRRRLRRSRAAIAIGCMTCRACRRVDLSSPCGVANERIQFGNAQSLHRRSRRVAAREERDAIGNGHRVLIADDLLATGGTARAVCDLVEGLGGKVEGLVFVVELEFLPGRKKLKGYDVRSLIKYQS